jgi:ribonuclease VapC
MILDASAVVAILNDEPEARQFAAAVAAADRVFVSAASLVEMSIVIGRDHYGTLDDFLEQVGAVVVDVDQQIAAIARDGHHRFGRGSGSPARLNLGDCFSYALAKHLGLPLLFKGDDFTHTDVEAAA